MRVIGPNALGIVNTDPEISLNASLAPAMRGARRSASSARAGR